MNASDVRSMHRRENSCAVPRRSGFLQVLNGRLMSVAQGKAGGAHGDARTARACNYRPALLLMALALIRPSSGMRMIVLGLLLAAAALVGMDLGLRNLLSGLT
jgi:hypothetical protein